MVKKTEAPRNKKTDYLKYAEERDWWTADPAGEAPLQESETGAANYKKGIPLLTVPEIFALACKNNGARVALRSEMMPNIAKGEKPPPPKPLKDWKSWTWQQYYDDSKSVAKAFISLGFQPHQACNIFGFNSPQWALSMMGAILAGGKAAGIYPSDNAEQVKFKADHSDGAIAVVENEAHLEKFRSVANELPMLKAIVTWACEPGEDIKTEDGRTISVMTWDELVAKGAALPDTEVDARLKNMKASNCCALIYTSGTTGNPKAVMMSHDNMMYTAHTVMKLPGLIGVKANEGERILSYLPLSHVAGMMVDIVAPIAVTANLTFKGWASTNFARTYDLKLGSLVDRLNTVKPTIFLGVPRVWEKIMEKLRAVGASTKGLKKAISTYAKKRGARYTSSRQLGQSAKTPFTMRFANVILGKIKQKLGLDKAKFMFSGAAPMTRECVEYFGSLGINVNEVYGMSETTGVITWSTDEYHVWGSVGFENTGVEVRIMDKASGDLIADAKDLFNPSEAEQGEIVMRGRNLMMGYMANPRLGDEHVKTIEQKNADAIDKRGWLHSGDKGCRDGRGMFKITGRYKELIIGAGGENIAPVPIEDELKRLCPFISNLMMVGNKRKFNVLLVTLKAVGATGELPGGDELAPPASGMFSSKTISAAMTDEKLIAAITKAIKDTNENKSVVPSNAAKIQKFTILPRDFSVLTGELTATLKLKRSVVDDEFEPIISKMYEVKDVYVNYTTAPTPDLIMGSGDDQPVFTKNLSFNVGEAMKVAEAEADKVQ